MNNIVISFEARSIFRIELPSINKLQWILEQQEITELTHSGAEPVLLSVISLGPTLPTQYKRAKALQRPQLFQI